MFLVAGNSMAKKRKRRKKKNSIFPFFLVLILVGGLLFAGFYVRQKREEARNKPPEYEKVSIETMEGLLNDNPKEAKKKYVGKKIEVTGTVFMTNKEEQYFMISKDINDYICGIQGNMKKGDVVDDMSSAKVGDTVTIKGKVTSAKKFAGYEMTVSEGKLNEPEITSEQEKGNTRGGRSEGKSSGKQGIPANVETSKSKKKVAE